MPKKKPGRKPLDDAVVESVRACIDQGLTQQEAIARAGVSSTKVYEFYRKFEPREATPQAPA